MSKPKEERDIDGLMLDPTDRMSLRALRNNKIVLAEILLAIIDEADDIHFERPRSDDIGNLVYMNVRKSVDRLKRHRTYVNNGSKSHKGKVANGVANGVANTINTINQSNKQSIPSVGASTSTSTSTSPKSESESEDPRSIELWESVLERHEERPARIEINPVEYALNWISDKSALTRRTLRKICKVSPATFKLCLNATVENEDGMGTAKDKGAVLYSELERWFEEIGVDIHRI